MTEKKKKKPQLPDAVAEKMREAAEQRMAVNPDPLPIAEPLPVEDEELVLSPQEIMEECAALPETDIANGERFRIRNGEKVIHVAKVGWHVYDGTRFKEDPDEYLVRPLAQRTAEFIDDEAVFLDCTPQEQATIEAGRLAKEALKSLGKPGKEWTVEQIDEHDRLQADVTAMAAVNKERAGRMSSRHGHAKSSCGTSKLNNMMNEAKPYLGTTVNELNQDLYAINTRSGTLRFIRGADGAWSVRCDPHQSRDRITKISPVLFRPDAVPVLLERFLRQMQPDAEMRAFLQRFMGYCLLGITTEHCLLFFYGAGRNGKSTFAELMADVLGDYAANMSIDSFAGDQQRKGSDATPDLARLPGVRLVTAEEPEMGVKLRGALIKKMTGGTKMDVRKLNEDFFEFTPQHKIIMSGNHKPLIIDDSDGMWARVMLILWGVQVAKDDIDKDLPAKLRTEMDAVFAWIVRGAIDYLNTGLNPPKSVTDATEEYRQESDPIGDFLRNACEVTGDDRDFMVIGDLFTAFEIFAKEQGLPKFLQSTFQARIAKQAAKTWKGDDGIHRQFRKGKCRDVRGYLGLRVKPRYTAHGRNDDPPTRGGEEWPSDL